VESRKSFTLIELMVVILIVGILAAVAIPIIRGQIDSAKWSEGKVAMGTIATALRAYAAEKDTAGNYGKGLPTLEELGFTAEDFQGKYFRISNYEVSKTSYKAGGKKGKGGFKYTITATAPEGITTPPKITLNEKGEWKVKKGKK
jgi:prepilin-type N-terminal cleavage/methylation domain-containing protein